MYIKKLFIVFFLTVSVLSADAKKLDDLYTSYLSDKGMVYFVFPFSMQHNKQSPKTKSPMKCDYTYISSEDSVKVLMTISLADLTKPSKLIVTSQDSTIYETSVALMYSDPHKNKFTYRFSASLPYINWQGIYKLNEPFKFIIMDALGNQYTYSYKQKEWIEYKNLFSQLFDIINISK